ncbi:MAG: SAF domain-containing protein [Mycobacterium sp.]
MGTGLNPSALERIARALRPDFTRTVRARRIAAGLLVLLAAAAAVRPDPAGAHSLVAVAARDLSPGIALTVQDVRIEQRPTATLPDGTQAVDQVVGATLAGPARRGEVLTDARVLGSRLAELSAGRDARVVPLHLADSAVLDVIRTGDVVDVLGAASGADAHPRLVAANAVVVLVSPDGPTAARSSGNDRVVLVALPAAAATALAGATLVQTVTLTIH